MTFDYFAYRELQSCGEAEDRYDEIEKMLHSNEPEAYFLEKSLKPATREAGYKQTKDYIEELNGYILSLEWELMNIKDFHYGKIEVKESEISDLFYEKLADVPILSRMEKIGEYIIDAEETLRDKNMSDEEKQEIFDRLNKMYRTRKLKSLYNHFLTESGRDRLDTSDGILRYEDVYPLLYLKYEIGRAHV